MDQNFTGSDHFWENVTFTGVMDGQILQLGNITITYNDAMTSTINTKIYLYEDYNGTTTLKNTDTRSGQNSFNYIVANINTSRSHYAIMYFNSSASFDVTSPVMITIPAMYIWNAFTPFDFEARTRAVAGDPPIGRYLDWGIFILALSVGCSVGVYFAGLGIMLFGATIGLGYGIAGWFTNSFNVGLIALAPFIIFLGIIVFLTKGKGEDNL